MDVNRIGVAEEPITGIWWIVRETTSGMTLDERLKPIRGPFSTKEAAINGLKMLCFRCNPNGAECSCP